MNNRNYNPVIWLPSGSNACIDTEFPKWILILMSMYHNLSELDYCDQIL